MDYFYRGSPFIVGTFLFCLAIFIIKSNPRRLLNWLLSLVCFGGVVWLYSCFLLYTLPAYITTILLLSKFAYLGVTLIAIFYVHFTSKFLDIKNRIFLVLTYTLGLMFIVATMWSDSIINGFFIYFWGPYPKAGLLNPMFWFYALSMFAYCLTQLYRFGYGSLSKQHSDIEKNRIRYVFWAYLLGNIGSVDFLPSYGLQFYPFGCYNIAIFISIVAFAIIRHQLLDIEVVMKKALIFAGLLASVFAILILPTLLIQDYILRSASFSTRVLGLAISGIIIILTMRRIETFLMNITDKYLFQKKYDYKQVLKSFIDEVLTILNLDDVIQKTVELLVKTLHPEKVDVLLINRYNDEYASYRALGYDKDIILKSSSRITKALKQAKDIVLIEGKEGAGADELKDEFGRIGVHLAIPLMLHDDLIGIMLLGKKKSDENYTQDDLDILTGLARTEAIAIGNAQLFADAAQNERRAAMGTLSAGINHEIGNPLNIINTNIQVYLMALGKGLYRDKDPKEVIGEAKDVMNLCLQQTARISDIARKLSNFAKPAKDFTPEPVDVAEQIEETLRVIGHELETERINVIKNIDKGLPEIMADKRHIQQILFNILRNAGQAIKENGVIEIKAYDKKNGSVHIEITDNGCGIPEDKIDKIYEPFYTTKDEDSGTGLGLSIVRQLVWRNKGDIKVKSKVGEGTTFTAIFTTG